MLRKASANAIISGQLLKKKIFMNNGSSLCVGLMYIVDRL